MQVITNYQTMSNINYANPVFGNRYLQVVTKPSKFCMEERLPEVIEDAVRANKSIQDFINSAVPQSWRQKLISLFKSDEVLQVAKSERVAASGDAVHFTLGKIGSKKAKIGILDLDQSQLAQYPNLESRPDKHEITSKILAEQIAKIKDIKSYLVNEIRHSEKCKYYD